MRQKTCCGSHPLFLHLESPHYLILTNDRPNAVPAHHVRFELKIKQKKKGKRALCALGAESQPPPGRLSPSRNQFAGESFSAVPLARLAPRPVRPLLVCIGGGKI